MTKLLLGPFTDLPEPEREQLTREAVTHTFPAGTPIWRRGDDADHLLVLQSGMVAVQSGERNAGPIQPDRTTAAQKAKTARRAKAGDRAKAGAQDSVEHTLTLAVLGAEDVLGEMGLAGVPRRTAAAVTLTETAALAIDMALLRTMRQASPDVDAIVMAILADTVRRLTDQVIEATFVPQPIRLRRILLRLARMSTDGSIRITHAQLAEMLGAQRTTVTALIAVEVAAGHLESGRGRLRIVDEAGLRAASR